MLTAPRDPTPPASQQTARPHVVLVVEDEILIRFALADYLRERGFRVYEAGNATEAIQLLSFYRTEVDVVFSDVKMPSSMDGFSLAVWIKQNRPGVPVILTSGEVQPPDGQLCALGLFFPKPYDLNAVVSRIESAAKARRYGSDEN